MKVERISRIGTRTSRVDETAASFADVLGPEVAFMTTGRCQASTSRTST